MHLSVGLPLRDLANRFSIHRTTVSRIITSWTHFLYQLLGSIRLWIPPEVSKHTSHQNMLHFLTHKWSWTAQRYFVRIPPLSFCIATFILCINVILPSKLWLALHPIVPSHLFPCCMQAQCVRRDRRRGPKRSTQGGGDGVKGSGVYFR